MIRLCVVFCCEFFSSVLFCWLSLCLNKYFSLSLTSKNGSQIEKSSYVYDPVVIKGGLALFHTEKTGRKFKPADYFC
ncbi:hypothetical protein IMY05_018G0116100 [Salix suchowensis]|nr:hypothetical protein IMY05_018G0116100 [Salix suchowensis]